MLPIAGCGALDGLSSGEASGSAQRSASETVSIVYDPALLNVMGYESADEAVEESGASHDPGSESGYLGATARDDGSVELTYSAEQYDYTVDWTKGQIEGACTSFASYYAGCSLEVAEDWQTIDCYLRPMWRRRLERGSRPSRSGGLLRSDAGARAPGRRDVGRDDQAVQRRDRRARDERLLGRRHAELHAGGLGINGLRILPRTLV